MEGPALAAWLKDLARTEGFCLAGIAEAGSALTLEAYQEWLAAGRHAGMSYLAASVELRGRLDSLLPGARSVLAVALNYSQPLPRKSGQPLIARYAQGRDYHKVMRRRLARIGAAVTERTGAKTRACVDSAPMLEREWAQRAGIGWPGKNTCLIHSRRGSWMLLGFLLTTLDLPPDQSAQGGCGTCRLCVDACPTGAIVHQEGRWQVDARSCISYWTIEHRGEIPAEMVRGIGDWTFGCDVCQEVCPFNQHRVSQPERAAATTDPDMLPRRDWPNLEQLAQISYDDWDQLTQGSAVRRAGWEGLRRNAAVNLANRPSEP